MKLYPATTTNHYNHYHLISYINSEHWCIIINGSSCDSAAGQDALRRCESLESMVAEERMRLLSKVEEAWDNAGWMAWWMEY